MYNDKIPDHIIIVGAGEYGLSTALALLKRPTFLHSHITVLESSHVLPNPSGSSVDASRIIRTDYASRAYAALASEAQVHWRDQTDDGWGGQGRYSQTGFVLTAETGLDHYVNEALSNVRNLANEGYPIDISKIEQLDDQDAIRRATGYEGVSGDKGYANWNSGWAHASKVVSFAVKKVLDVNDNSKTNRVTLRKGVKVKRLKFQNQKCTGVILDNASNTKTNIDEHQGEGPECIAADLIILACGAWTPSLIDLQGQCLATGQALGYISITAEEQARFENKPVTMNLSDGMFMIPPTGQELKIARHAFGYQNLQEDIGRYYDNDDDDENNNHQKKKKRKNDKISIPVTGVAVPQEGQDALRSALGKLVPALADRPFSHTRLCWYCDTQSGDFLIDYHPEYQGLFVATGGSGHAFKFFPILGEKIVDRIENKLIPELTRLWKWPQKRDEFRGCEDGSRSGQRGLILDDCRPINSSY